VNQEQEKEILRRARVSDSLFDLNNVQSFYPGTKIKNGVDTGEPCLVVGVTKKVRSEDLRNEDLIPELIGDNLQTDVVEESELSRFGNCGLSESLGQGVPPYGPCDGHDYNSSGDPFANALGGISIGPNDPLRRWSGTLGFIAKDVTDSKLVGVSNNHVLGDYVDTDYSPLGCYLENGELLDEFKLNEDMSPLVQNMIQTPSVPDSSRNSVILGEVKRAIATKWGSSVLPANTVDAAIVELTEDIHPMTDLAHLSESALKVAVAKIGERVSKSGRTTGVTGVSSSTRIVSTNYTVAIGSGCEDGLKTKFTDCIKFNWNAERSNNWEFFSYAGDSGSAIMMDEATGSSLVGLLFAGTYFQNSTSMPNPPYGTGVACKIQNVFSALNIEAWNGNVICGANSRFVKVNGRCYRNSNTSKPLELISHQNHEKYGTLGECVGDL
jgi:hypothetical protein